jgi:4'-phosphopantetheinyl transferase EntD
VAAAVAWKDVVAGIGVDIESRGHELRASLGRFICTPAERTRLSGLMPELDGFRLTFSAKESVYKCVAPLSGIALGFHDVELDIDVVGQSFRARAASDRGRAVPELSLLSGRFIVTPRFVITAATILAAGGVARLPHLIKE